MAEKKIFWEGSDKDYNSGKYMGVILNPKEIFEAVSTFEFRFKYFPGINGDTKIEIPETIVFQDEEYETIHKMSEYNLEKYLDELVGVEGKWAHDDYITIENILCFDFDEMEFFNLNNCESLKCYSYVCNSNWKTITFNDAYDTEYELEVLNSFNLDIWDGSNHYFPKRSTGNHALLEKVLVDEEEKLFWHEWSQWQGSELDTGYFITAEEVLERLEDHPEIEEITEWLKNAENK